MSLATELSHINNNKHGKGTWISDLKQNDMKMCLSVIYLVYMCKSMCDCVNLISGLLWPGCSEKLTKLVYIFFKC